LLKRQDLIQLARSLNGLPVYGCLPGSPAEKAGVRFGDVLLSVDGLATPTWEAYIEARAHSGESIRLRLFRNGTEFEVDVVLDRSLTHDASTLVSALGILDSRPSETN
jgi:C-terminal processing protease CtpA/Prc